MSLAEWRKMLNDLAVFMLFALPIGVLFWAGVFFVIYKIIQEIRK